MENGMNMRRRDFLKSAALIGAGISWPWKAKTAVAADRAVTDENSPGIIPGPYKLTADSLPQPGVPRGKTFGFSIGNSKIFPGEHRGINVYVPAQYKPETPACVFVMLDGIWWSSVSCVFDNLIHQGHLPVTIVVGLGWGETASARAPENPRYDRSFDFDSMTTSLADFIVQELLPEVQQHKTPDGLPIRLSADPNDRGIGGISTGGIGAFTVAWQRPDAFRRVCTSVGTFVGMRGGDHYPVLIRKTEPKPLRVFLNDEEHDGWPGGLEFGDWWMDNREMARALSFAGYEVSHVWGDEGHDAWQFETLLPEIMRWLWQDWPKPIKAGKSKNVVMQCLLNPDDNWELVLGNPALEYPGFQGYAALPVVDKNSTAAALSVDQKGEVYYQDPSDGTINWLTDAGNTELFAKVSPGNNGLNFGPDGRLYVAEAAKARIIAIDSGGKIQVIATGIACQGLTMTHSGNIYVTEADHRQASYSGKVWLIRPDGARVVVADKLNGPSGVCVTSDGLWLFVGESKGRHGYNYQVKVDGTLEYGQPFYWFGIPDNANDSGVGQICMDSGGWSYAATRMGVQVFDRNGRVAGILPIGQQQLAGICFAGKHFQTMYVSTGKNIYRRKVSDRLSRLKLNEFAASGTMGFRPRGDFVGVPPWLAPFRLPPPECG